MSLLWWGFRKKITKYAGKCYTLDSLLKDPKPRSLWIAKPNTTAEFVFKGKNVIVASASYIVNVSVAQENRSQISLAVIAEKLSRPLISDLGCLGKVVLLLSTTLGIHSVEEG